MRGVLCGSMAGGRWRRVARFAAHGWHRPRVGHAHRPVRMGPASPHDPATSSSGTSRGGCRRRPAGSGRPRHHQRNLEHGSIAGDECRSTAGMHRRPLAGDPSDQGRRRLLSTADRVTRLSWSAAALAASLLLAACTSGPEDTGTDRMPSDRGTTNSSQIDSTKATTAPPPEFTSSIRLIDEPTQERMAASWRAGCPVPLQDLRLATVSYWDFDGAERTGEIVVHADYATDVVSVFDALFTARFPIAQMRLVDDFGGDDDRSMAANNTSGFNCRAATGSDA